VGLLVLEVRGYLVKLGIDGLATFCCIFQSYSFELLLSLIDYRKLYQSKQNKYFRNIDDELKCMGFQIGCLATILTKYLLSYFTFYFVLPQILALLIT
jgi:hypothetical protein